MAKQEFNEKTFLKGFELVLCPRKTLYNLIVINVKNLTIAGNLVQEVPVSKEVLLYYDPKGKRLAIVPVSNRAPDSYILRKLKNASSYVIGRSHEFVPGRYSATVIGGKFIVAEGIERNPIQEANEQEKGNG
jgi:hypothetical protein